MKLTQNKLMEILHIRDKMYKHSVYATTKYSTNQYKSPYNIITTQQCHFCTTVVQHDSNCNQTPQ